jgi:hypothetical protein
VTLPAGADAAMSSLRRSYGSGAGSKWGEDLESDTIARLNRVTRGQTETSERLLLALSQRSAGASLRRSTVEDAPDDGYLLKEELQGVREEVASLSPTPPPELRACSTSTRPPVDSIGQRTQRPGATPTGLLFANVLEKVS